jgi:hypothetical protein
MRLSGVEPWRWFVRPGPPLRKQRVETHLILGLGWDWVFASPGRKLRVVVVSGSNWFKARRAAALHFGCTEQDTRDVTSAAHPK